MPRRKPNEAGDEPMTENEGSLLSLILRRQPVTAYQLIKDYEDSPVTSFNNSKGGVYPAIRRLKERGLIVAKPVPDDRRNAEMLECTPAGAEAVRSWAMALRSELILLDDPLRTRLLSLGQLSKAEKLVWIAEAKSLVADRIKRVDDYAGRTSVPFQSIAYKSAIDALRAKMDWLDALLYQVVKDEA